MPPLFSSFKVRLSTIPPAVPIEIIQHEVCDHPEIIKILWQRLGAEHPDNLAGFARVTRDALSHQADRIRRNVNLNRGITKSWNHE
jgi:hypothetical protein